MRGAGLALWLVLAACQSSPGGATPQPEPAAAKPAEAAQPAPAASNTAASNTAASNPAAAPSPAAATNPVSSAPAGGPVRPASAGSGSEKAAAGKPGAAELAGTKPGAAPKREARKGAVVSEEPFSAWLEGDAPLSANEPSTLRVVLQAKPPYHCNPEYPHKFTLAAAPSGVSYPSPIVKGMKVTEAEGVLPVPVVAGAAGQATVKGNLAFSVCTAERCLVEKRELALDLEIR